uniref:Uncharacterized protein n=1 Tax=Cutibacterium granulosum DSM 20700 TaxID=1160719 RepID=A0A9X5LR88_9ACTN
MGSSQVVLPADVEQTSRRLHHDHAHRVAVLTHHCNPVVLVEGDDAHGTGVGGVLTLDPLPGRGGDGVIDEITHPSGGQHLVLIHLPGLGSVPATHLESSFLLADADASAVKRSDRDFSALEVCLLGSGTSRSSPLARRTAAAASPRNNGWAWVGRLLSSGWAWVATKNGWLLRSNSTNSTREPSGEVPLMCSPAASRRSR